MELKLRSEKGGELHPTIDSFLNIAHTRRSLVQKHALSKSN